MWWCSMPAAEWSFDVAKSRSKSRNTPFDGAAMLGRVMATICEGRLFTEDKRLALTKYLRLFVLLPHIGFICSGTEDSQRGCDGVSSVQLDRGSQGWSLFCSNWCSVMSGRWFENLFRVSLPQKTKLNGEEMVTQFGLMPEGQRVSILFGRLFGALLRG